MDWIPGISQLKSICQLVTGDVAGAAKTQETFFKECPVVSQITSVLQVCAGDTAGAIDTQMRCLDTFSNVTTLIPVMGHCTGYLQQMLGDHEGGKLTMNAATRSLMVVNCGIVGGMATGDIGAILAGIAAGIAYDLRDTATSGEPQGLVAVIETAVNNPNAGNIFDATAIVVGIGLSGYACGQIETKISPITKLFISIFIWAVLFR